MLIGGSLLGFSAKDHIGTHQHHRAYHFLSFGATAALYMTLVNSAVGEFRAALVAFALGLSIETLQHFIFVGPMEWWDVRDDAIGIAVALLVFRMIARFAK